ncbi:ATP-binding protein [Chloroflexus sp.]|uniref:ATP-binding protein n=1 Tax=Chloroflexus sp. TaxID=1904827 RepID=UPI00298F3C67|nr:ATP-binding protein [Chloroflexus sp.]MDW8404787.1 PAS domain S-box protein [Chloroflexus sp.]
MNLRRFISNLWPTGQQLNQLFADEQQRVAIFLLPIFGFLAIIAGLFAILAPFLYVTPQIPLAAALTMTVVFASGAWLVRRGAVHMAGGLVCGVLWLVITIAVLFTGGVRSSAALHYVIVALLAGLSFGRRGAIVAVGTSSAAIVVLWGLEETGRLPAEMLLMTPLSYTIILLAILLLTGMMLVVVDIQLSAAFAATRMEITERARAEQRLRLALLAARAGVWEWDAVARAVRWSPENYPLLGLNPDQDTLTFRKWREQVHPEDRAALQAAVDRSINERAAFDVEFRVILPDGSLRWLRGVGQPVVKDDGTLQGMHGLQIDVTAQKMIEAELRRSELYFRSLVDDLPAMVCRFRADGTLTFVNDLYCQTFQRSREELIGFNFYELIPPDRRALVADGIAQLSPTQPVMEHEHEVLYPDGSIGWQRWVNRLLLDEQGSPVEYQALGIDITARKKAEIERERLIAELEARNAELEQFTYTVSHDLKSPLITIKGFAGYIERDLAAGKLERIPADLQRIIAAADRMYQLLEDLLNLSRAGRQLNRPERIGLGLLISEAAAGVSGRLAERNVYLHLPPNLPDVYGDRTRLREVFQNLIDNAAKFMGDQSAPQIWIDARPADEANMVLVSVRDNGIGINPRYLQRIFGLFERLDQRIEGTGIGLALVRRIVEAHGGKIWAESEGLGRGATFYLTLPAPPNA